MLRPSSLLARRVLLPALLLALTAIAVACGSDSPKQQRIVPEPAPAAIATLAPSDASQSLALAAAATAPMLQPRLLPEPWAAPPAPRSDPNVPAPEVSAIAAVVIDEASGAVLFDKQAHLPLPPASLTKIATLALALEHGGLDEPVDIDVDSTQMRGSTIMGLLPGDRFTLRDLLYGLMLPSGNDAALAIGRDVAGSDAAFVVQMNALLGRLGLHDSHFLNPHGLGGGNHVTSAYDLAMLSRYGMSLPLFKDIVNTSHYVAKGNREISLWNINSFLGYKDADGVKTGYTRGAGSTLAASMTRNGHRLYAVMLNDPSRNADAYALLNWAFANYVWPAAQ